MTTEEARSGGPLPFEFVVDGPPVSAQTRRRERLREWKDTVRRAVETYWPAGVAPVAVPVLVEVHYLYEGASADVDNIIKPIQDAMNGLVYADDEQVTDVVGRKRSLDGSLRISRVSEVLAEGLGRGNEFLYVVVREAPDQEAL